ncbi:MAG: SseB family protein [Acidimicrobiales bacterium]
MPAPDPAAAPDLGGSVARFQADELTAEEFTEVFMRSRVYCVRPERPGFLAVGPRGGGHIPVFSSLTELARYAAKFPEPYADGVDWFSTTGEDLLSLVPEGYGLVIDVASDDAVHLDAAAIQRKPVLTVRPREESDGRSL